MEERKKGLPIVSLILGIVGFCIMMSATPFDTSVIGFATFVSIIGLICAIISVFNSDYKKVCAVIGIVLCIISFSIKFDLDKTRNGSITYKNEKNVTTKTDDFSTTITTKNPLTIVKPNYQQVYNEYSQKLKKSGPTSSITEMAEILNEGVMKMAEYMYSAKGVDGQYQTYQSWVNKLTQVYMNECR